MKKYIGAREVDAEPMTMGEAYERGFLQAGRVPNETEKDNAGYHVKYQDGYESWSPAEPFEQAYKVADTVLERLLLERMELSDRIGLLKGFVGSDGFKEVDGVDRAMLDAQVRIMDEYRRVLSCRGSKMETGKGGYGCFSFGVALALLDAGYSVRRSRWNLDGRNIMVFRQESKIMGRDIPDGMQSIPRDVADVISGGVGFVNYAGPCFIYNKDTGSAESWVPSVGDMFAVDWEYAW